MENIDLLCMSCFSPLPGSSVIAGSDPQSPAINAACPVCGYVEGTQTQPPHQLPIRTILNGKYLVGKAIGEGGFGITYIGYDLNLDIRVAIKEYFPSGFASRTATVSETVTPHTGDTDGVFLAGRERFVGEAKRLAHFRNLPGIVMVNDFFAENGTAYIVMEFVEGQTLKAYLSEHGGTMPIDTVLQMLTPIFISLEQVHGGGIIHRDISPDNVMITPDGTVKLLDFGAAREFSESGNKSLSVLLKHGYAPMEQYSTKGVQGPHTDVYALAATIYRAITGTTPESAMDRIISDTVAPPSSLGVTISPQQEAALMKALAVRSEDRFQTAGEFYTALTDADSLRHCGLDPQSPEPVVGGDAHIAPQTATPANAPNQANVIAAPEPQSPQTPQGIAGQARNDASKKTPAIIAAAVAAVVIIRIILAFAIPGMGGGNRGYSIIAVGLEDVNYPVDLFEGSRWSDITEVAIGSYFIAGLKSNGTVVLEIMDTPSLSEQKLDDEFYVHSDVTRWRDITSVAAGYSHIVGLKSDGTVTATELNAVSSSFNFANGRGQCDVSDWQDILAISAGMSHTVGLKTDGTVVAAGGNDGPMCNVSNWRDIIAVSAGGSFTVGLKSDGTIETAGWYELITEPVVAQGISIEDFYNDYGYLFDVSGWYDIVEVSAGMGHITGLRSDGTVVAVHLLSSSYVDTYDVTNWRDIIAIASGETSTVGIKSDGTVVATGSRNIAGIGGSINEYDFAGWYDITEVFAGFNGITVGFTTADPRDMMGQGSDESGDDELGGQSDQDSIADETPEDRPNIFAQEGIPSSEIAERFKRNVNGGHFDEKDGWVYFTYRDSPYDRDIRKINEDLSETVILAELPDRHLANYVNVVGDWVYFKMRNVDEFDNVTVNRVRTDGTGFETVNITDYVDYATQITGIGNWIYCTSYSSFFRFSAENPEIIEFLDYRVGLTADLYLTGDGERFYFTDNGPRIESVNISTNEYVPIFDSGGSYGDYYCRNLIFDEGWLYFAFHEDGRDNPTYIYRMRPDGSEAEILTECDYSSSYFSVSDGWIYYMGADDNLWKIRTNGENNTSLDVGLPDYINIGMSVFGDWVYYMNHQMCHRVSTDGTVKERLR